MQISFTVPGNPVAKGRARAFKRGNHIGHYTPATTANYENLVKLLASQEMAGKKLIDGPVSLFLNLTFAIPESWPRKKKEKAIFGEIYPTVKPDLDNCQKLICDALNGVVWVDDKQVVDVRVRKYYSSKPCAVVSVEPIG